MKLLLITPPYHAGVVESAGRWPHLGLIYIAGHVRAAGFEVEYYDAMTKDHDLEQIKERIRVSKPDVVGSTAYTASLPAAMQVLSAAKELNPGIKTVMGGIHANFMYEEMLRQYPEVLDFVIRGEGEQAMPELMQALAGGKALSAVLGLSYRAGDTIISNPKRPFVEDLDSLIPAWDLVDWQDYTFFVMPGSRLGLVNSSRGCPHNCVFCSQQKFWEKTYRERSALSVVQELEHLRDTYGVNVVMLSDEYPTRNGERWREFLELMIDRQVNVKILMETCVADILRDREIIAKYRQAGVLHVYLGVEATDQQTLDQFKKDISCEQAKESLQLLNDAGILTECSFVLGMPDDTLAKIETTLELAKHYNPDFAHFLMIAPWPYADLYQEIQPYVKELDYSKYNFVEPVVEPKAMTMAELEKCVIDCYRRYYTTKVPEWLNLQDELKKDYLIRSMKVMMENSFLRKYMQGNGEMPAAIKKMLEID